MALRQEAMHPSEAESLLGAPLPSSSSAALRVYRTRFWVLLSFSLIGMCQCMNCFTLTSLPDSSEKYFNITQGELIVIFNWQPLANTIGALFAAGLYSTLGTRSTARLLAVLATAGPAIRCVPSLLPAVLASRPLRLLCLHASSVINGCGGPILNSAPALLSAIWFPAHERMTATGILGTCPILGSMVGFALGPRMVHHYTQLPSLLYAEAIGTAVCGLLIWIHFPDAPPTPPSGAAQLRAGRAAEASAEEKSELQVFLAELPATLRTWPFIVTCLSANTFLAIYANAWQTIAPSMFVAADYTEADANSFMLVVTVTSVVGGMLSGPLLALSGGRLKLLELLSLVVCVAGLAGLTALLPTPWWSEPLFAAEGGDDAGSSSSSAGGASAVADRWVVLLLLIVLGFAQGVSWPPLFEIVKW